MRGNGRQLALGIACLLAVVAPLPFGATRPMALVSLGLILAAAAVLLWIDRSDLARPPARFLWLTVLTVAWILLQLVPLPPTLLVSASPRLAEQARASLSLPGEPEDLALSERKLAEFAGGERDETSWHPIAADPDGGLDGALRLGLALAAFCLGLLAVRDSRDRRWLVAAVGVSAFLQAVYGLAESLSGHHHIFFWAKVHYRPLASGTFICPNHFAALLSLGLFAFLGLLAELWQKEDEKGGSDRRAKTSLAATAAGIVVVGMIWSSSRAGLAAAAVGVALLAALLLPRLARRRASAPALIATGVLVAGLVAGAVWIRPPQPLANDVENITVDIGGRTMIWRSGVEIAKDFWRTGSGIGSFRYVHPLYRPATASSRFVHAHNDYLEWVADTGVIGALLLLAWLAALTVTAVQIRRRERGKAMSAALIAALTALALHETVDFSLQLPGVAIPAFLLGGALFAPASWGPGRPASTGPQAWPRLLIALGAALLAGTGWMLYALRPLPAVASARAISTPVDAEHARRWAREQIDHVLRASRKGDPLEKESALPLLGGAYLSLQRVARRAPLRGDLRITEWLAAQSLLSLDPARVRTEPELALVVPYYLERAEALAPADRRRRLVLARYWLLAGNAPQARRVIRGLLEMKPSLAREAYDLLGGEDLPLADLMGATPNTPLAALQLSRYLAAVRRDPVGAQIVLERALGRHPGDWRLRVAFANRLSSRHRDEQALEVLDEAPPPEDPTLRRHSLDARARALSALGRLSDLEPVLDRLERLGAPSSALAMYRGIGWLRAGKRAEAIAALEQALAEQRPPLEGPQRLRALILLGQQWQKEGEYRKALEFFRQAREIDPEHPAVKKFFEMLR